MALGVSVGVGLLVGMQRERVSTYVAGVRTFPLITLLGTVSGLLASVLGVWIIVVAFLGVVIATVVSNLIELQRGEPTSGITTEISIALMFSVGVMLAMPALREVAVAIAAAIAVLLHAKDPLHRFVRTLGDKDVHAIMQFVVITFIILPILPDRTFTTLEVLNPRHIWLMVVLVVGISLGGYVAYKVFGKTAGVALGGVIGGIISSTATTVSYARRTRGASGVTSAAALVLLLATCVMYVRVLIEILVVSPSFFTTAVWPIGALFIATAALSASLWFPARNSPGDMPAQDNPSELKSALFFGLLYAAMLAAVAAAKMWFDDTGLYVVAGLAGMTEMNAITLSTARLVEEGRLEATAGWRAIVIAIMTNLVFKCAVVLTLGGRRLFAVISGLFSIIVLIGVALLLFL